VRPGLALRCQCERNSVFLAFRGASDGNAYKLRCVGFWELGGSVGLIGICVFSALAQASGVLGGVLFSYKLPPISRLETPLGRCFILARLADRFLDLGFGSERGLHLICRNTMVEQAGRQHAGSALTPSVLPSLLHFGCISALRYLGTLGLDFWRIYRNLAFLLSGLFGTLSASD